jgi:hypothetical protein
MNVNMTTDEFHDVIMLYLIQLARDTKGTLDDPDTFVFSEEFDAFLRHIQSRPLGRLKTSYMREDQRTKVLYKRMLNAMSESDNVRLII